MVLVVLGIIVDGDRVLLTQRPPGNHLPLYWEFPAGKIESGEDPTTALQRELREEAGIEISPIRALTFRFYRYPARDVLLLPYLCRIVAGQPKAADCHSIGWFALSEFSSLKIPEANGPIVEELVSLLRHPRDEVF